MEEKKEETEDKGEPEKETAAGNELNVTPGSVLGGEGEAQETEEAAQDEDEDEEAEEGAEEETEDDEEDGAEEEYEDDEDNNQNLGDEKAEKLVTEADQPLEGYNLENRDAKSAAKSAATRQKAAKSLSRRRRQRLQKKRH